VGDVENIREQMKENRAVDKCVRTVDKMKKKLKSYKKMIKKLQKKYKKVLQFGYKGSIMSTELERMFRLGTKKRANC